MDRLRVFNLKKSSSIQVSSVECWKMNSLSNAEFLKIDINLLIRWIEVFPKTHTGFLMFY